MPIRIAACYEEYQEWEEHFQMQRTFSRGGFQTKHFIWFPPPFSLFPLPLPPSAQRLHFGSDATAGAFPTQDGWSSMIIDQANTACHDQVGRGKVLYKHMDRHPLTACHPAHFPVPRSPCSQDRAVSEEGGGGGG
jgi:hypothetical protein